MPLPVCVPKAELVTISMRNLYTYFRQMKNVITAGSTQLATPRPVTMALGSNVCPHICRLAALPCHGKEMQDAKSASSMRRLFSSLPLAEDATVAASSWQGNL